MKKFIKKTIAGLIAGVMAISSMPFTALAADEIPEITGAIKYSSVIFTHGTNTVSTDYNFMMRGTQIASGDVKSATDCKTTVSVANGVTINSVSCVEDSNAQLSVSNNVLTGNFGSNHDDSTVTLKTNVTYNGKSYVSYNKVYVDTIPVPAHAGSISQRWYGPTNPLKSIMAYSQTLKGSLGQNSTDGSSDSNGVSANVKELFVPGTQIRYDNINDTNHWRLTSNISIDKVAGQTGYKKDGGWGKGTTTLTTTAPTGYYYFDKSTTDNYGFSAQNGSSFTFDMVTIPFNIVTGDNASGGNVDLNTHNLTGANFTQTDPYSTFSYDSGTGVPSTKIFTNKITGDASSITNGTMTGSYELRFANNNSNGVWGVNITKSNWNVYVADKSAARNPYNLANSEIKTSDSYTADSWNAYKTAYLEDEEFLSNYKNVTLDNVQTTASEKGIKLTTAYNNLVAKVVYSFVNFKGDIVSTVEASSVEEALKSAPTNSKTSYKSNGSENHTVTTYSWPTSSTSTTIKEVATDKVEAHDFSSGTCVCGAIALQTQEYDTALEQAKAEAKNPNGRYTTDSINALNSEITAVEAERVSVTTQAQLEELTKRLLTAISNLVQSKFNVVFVTVGLDSTTEDKKFDKYIEYGKTCDADAGANVKKWVVTTDNGNTSTVIDNFDQKASFVITKDAKIYAYLSGEDSSKTSSKVTFLGRHNQVVAIRYVADGKTLETKDVDAPSIPFYKFENWDVASVKGDGNEYTVKASYTCNQVSDFCTVHFGDWSKAYAYDSYVYLPNTVAGTKYALYSDKECTKLLTVLDGVDFYAPKTSDIYVKAYDDELKASIAVTGSFAEKDVEAGKNYANFNCKFYLPVGANAIEWGVEVLSPDGTKTANVKGEKLSERNEYTVRFGTTIGSSVTSIKGRAYLVYEQDGVKTTIYSSDEYVEVIFNA